MSGITVSGNNAKDIEGRYLYIDFYSAQGGSATGATVQANREVDRICQVWGNQFSYVCANIPFKNALKAGLFDGEFANVAPAANSSGPAGQLKLLSRVSAGLHDNNRKQPLMNGWITNIAHLLRSGSVVPTAVDDRFLLTKMILMGRQVHDKSTGQIYWDMDNEHPLVFNAIGPDMILIGGEPYFATGYRVGNVSIQEESDTADSAYGTDAAEGKAGYWTVTYILRYIRRCVYENVLKFEQDVGQFEIPKQFLKWQKTLGSNIKEDRKVQAFKLDGFNVLDALDATVKMAGSNYTLYMEPLNHLQSELKVINGAPQNQAGCVVYDAEYLGADIGECMNNPSIAWDGVINEDANDTFHGGSAIIGDTPVVEGMLSTYTGQDEWESPGGLEFAYTSQSIAAWVREVHSYASQVDPPSYTTQGIEFANNKYPDCWSFYRISNRVNPFAGTLFASWKRAGLLTCMTHQLSAYNEELNNPLGLQHREIIVEYRLSDEEWQALVDAENQDEMDKGHWRFLGRYTGLQLSPCGKFIMLPDARAGTTESAGTYYAIDTADVDEDGDPDNTMMSPLGSETAQWKRRHIRIQVAVKHNEALVARGGKNDEDKTGTLHRIDPKAPKFVFQARAQPKQYVYWTRTGYSAPVGMAGLLTMKSVQIRRQFPAKVLFNDIQRMQDHADVHAINYKRVACSGSFVLHCLSSVYSPGRQITYINGKETMNYSGIINSVTYQGQKVVVSFGPGSPVPLFDAPVDSSSTVASGNYPPATTNTGKKSEEPTYDDTSKTTSTETVTETSKGGESPSSSGSGSSGSQPASESSDNDSDANNQAINSNKTASQNMSQGTFSNGKQALGQMAATAAGDTKGFQAMGKALGADGPSGSDGASGASSADLDDEEREMMEDRKAEESRKKYDGKGLNAEIAGETQAPAKKGTIRADGVEGYEQIKSKDYNLDAAGSFDAETRKAGKGIYSGDSLKGLDADRAQAAFGPGGIKDTFRQGAGQKVTTGRPAQESWADKTFGKADKKTGLRIANVERGGFNPTNAVAGAKNLDGSKMMSSKDFNAQGPRKPVYSNPGGGWSPSLKKNIGPAKQTFNPGGKFSPKLGRNI